ncbi:MAG: hypothetical protein QOG80_2352 [Pseudonocardiales bacterium]|jgi:hypothetical protein|nr:hypothetical protein [Pseudonocardiales bacterium]
MFIQVVRGTLADEAGFRKIIDRWNTEVKPGAIGYLGTTAGVLDGGGFVICARFESEELAMQNSGRPEQGAFFAEASQNFAGEPEFINVTDVEPWLDGGSDDAGFVQVMIGHSPDRAALRDAARSNSEGLRAARPEIIGGMQGFFGDDGFVNIGYFTSEAEARTGEASDPPTDVAGNVDEFQRLMGEVEFLDIHEPILFSK